MPDDARALPAPRKGAISPLVPVLVPLAVAAILIGFALARLFPSSGPAPAPAPVRFKDVTAESGIDFTHDNGVQFGRNTPTTLPGAVAFLDTSNDGREDLFFVGGTSWPWNTSLAGVATSCAFYRNDGKGHFTNVTQEAGLDANMLGMSVAVGDYDGDGYPDIFVTGIGGNRLFHNLGNGTFADVTDAAGVGGDDHLWSTGAVWIDIFGDGRLDLVVCNYARWSRASSLQSAFEAQIAGPSYAAPAGFASAFPTVYRNLGNGRFADVSEKCGLNIIDRQTGYARATPLVVTAVDANGDGRLDLLFTYQSGPDVLFLNQGDGTFREWRPPGKGRREGASASLLGTGGSFSRPDQPIDRLGILRRAGLALSPNADESGPYCRLGDKLGVALLDYDLDGRMDIVSAEGLAEPGLARFESGREFAAVPQLLWNNGRAWAPAPAAGPSPGPLGGRLIGRGVAVGDVRGDGSLEIVIAQNGGPPRLLQNEARVRNAWLRVDLVGTHCQRDAGGARVEVHTPSGVLVQTMEPAMGFMAQSEKTLTFGLGADSRVRSVVVRWPSGVRQVVKPGGVNRRIVITEPK